MLTDQELKENPRNAEVEVPGLTDADLQTHAEAAKKECPVS